jgi:hypothetical protein
VGPVDRSDGVLGMLSGTLFLKSSEIHPTLLSLHERLLCVRYVWLRAIRILSVGCA